ncbi:MAG: DNA alkylation repair protein [Candidatus Ventricola sp.]
MLTEKLLSMQDVPYRDFQRKLIPGLAPETIIGVRTLQLRRLARQLRGTPEAADFMAALPHRFFEENQVHAGLIMQEKDFDACLALVNNFLPYVDNWATCDQLSPKALQTDLLRLMDSIRAWLASDHPYTVRFGVNCLMQWYLGEAFDPSVLEMVATLQHEDYYVRMGVAWYFATALALQYDAALPYIEQRRLKSWTHNKAIQKAIESRRITPAQKDALRAMRIGRIKQA